jgi:E3 ubiquitin-protein ligase DOA10
MEKMLKMWRNKRAITPVLSNVLLMVIAVAGMSIAITATYVITGNLHDTMGERFIVEDVWFRTDAIAIYLRNTGKTAIDVGAVYVDYAAQSFASLHFEPTEHGWLNLTYTWTANAVYHIKIVTNRGTQVAEYYRSPA